MGQQGLLSDLYRDDYRDPCILLLNIYVGEGLGRQEAAGSVYQSIQVHGPK